MIGLIFIENSTIMHLSLEGKKALHYRAAARSIISVILRALIERFGSMRCTAPVVTSTFVVPSTKKLRRAYSFARNACGRIGLTEF